jgi:hypothetical protein
VRRDELRWKTWADDLRQSMMTSQVSEVTKSVSDISKETETERPAKVLSSQRFWNACRDGQESHKTIAKAGFDINYEPNAAGHVEAVTFRLNGTWLAILQRVLDRQQ